MRNWYDDMKEKFTELPEVLTFIDAVQTDVLDQVEFFKSDGQEETPALPFWPSTENLAGEEVCRQHPGG